MRLLQPATAVSRALREVLARTELKSSFAATTSMVVCEPHKRANRATLRGDGITQRPSRGSPQGRFPLARKRSIRRLFRGRTGLA